MAGEPSPVYHSSATGGFSAAVSEDPRRIFARKIEHRVAVRFTPTPCVIETAEGRVHAKPGDAILTGVAGEQWRVSQARFAQKYRPLPPTMPGEPGVYMSLPNRVLALKIAQPFEVVLADGVSRLHGRAGDWLVDYGDGSLGVVASAIFDQTYEILP
jgi:hypothetical protein